MEEYTMELMEFIDESPSPFHAVERVRGSWRRRGIAPGEGEPWSIGGGRCYVTRNGSSLIAFQVPGDMERISAQRQPQRLPYVPDQGNGELEGPENYLRLNTERYGGMLCAPGWTGLFRWRDGYWFGRQRSGEPAGED